jgi:hypothetical protein
MSPTQTTAQILWEMTKVILPALIAGVGAWIGGRLSVSREMEKLRNERAFDHRLEWYRRAARGIVENQWFFINFSRAIEAGDVTLAKELAARRDETKVAREADQREMTLFASPATIAALNRSNVRAGNALKGASLSGQAAQIAVLELNNAYFVLANDVREHLGMKPLTLQELKAMTPDSANTKLDKQSAET